MSAHACGSPPQVEVTCEDLPPSVATLNRINKLSVWGEGEGGEAPPPRLPRRPSRNLRPQSNKSPK